MTGSAPASMRRRRWQLGAIGVLIIGLAVWGVVYYIEFAMPASPQAIAQATHENPCMTRFLAAQVPAGEPIPKRVLMHGKQFCDHLANTLNQTHSEWSAAPP